ncbi:MAG: hypothetical protein Q4E64_04275 [Phascolarctobacterium sp.]|uniref:hypothetical protein n=1 Tax=Phascolarctobacterium sp. TaxID=2049039 RepID=UPI0026DC516C|nr:hypothetical protein [Phascolarctobacterium sp.]MDO4921029.1 hypothetical protein [Phascolarctobacterium sp.]
MLDFFKDYTWVIITCLINIYKFIKSKRRIAFNELMIIILSVFMGGWLLDYFSANLLKKILGTASNHILGALIMLQYFFVIRNAYTKIKNIENIDERKKKLKRFCFESIYLVFVFALAIWYVGFYK